MWHWMMKEAAGFANPPTGWGTHLRRWAVVMREGGGLSLDGCF